MLPSIRNRHRTLAVLSLSFSAVAGALGYLHVRDPGSGPLDIAWGKETDARCHMVIDDRHFAAQVRDAHGKVWKFDDIGCAMFWLAQQGVDDTDPALEIWVADYRSGEWLAARGARFVEHLKTPMRYGFGASGEAAPDAIDYAEMKRRVLARGR